MIIDKLIDRIKELSSPICVGLDTYLGVIPEEIVSKEVDLRWKTRSAVREAITAFNKEVIDVIADIVPAVKIQVAMYEEYGPEGMQSYLDTILYAHDKGLIVIGDVKRGDVPSTSMHYSNAHLGKINILDVEQPVYNTEFITVNPYMGYNSLEPFIDECSFNDKGLFVLVKTSNTGSTDFQDLLIDNPVNIGERIPLYQEVARIVDSAGEATRGEYGYSSIGAVVGATHPVQLKQLREKFPGLFFLIPGYGAQGGGIADILPGFSKEKSGCIINSSRGIIGAHLKPEYIGMQWKNAIRQATLQMIQDIKKGLG